MRKGDNGYNFYTMTSKILKEMIMIRVIMQMLMVAIMKKVIFFFVNAMPKQDVGDYGSPQIPISPFFFIFKIFELS